MKGKGVFVRRPAQLTRIAPQRYFRGQEARAYVREAEASAVGLDVQQETTRTTTPTDIATRLGIAEGDPVVLTRYFIVETADIVFAADRYELRYVMEIK
jgi:GntR family transcriptional regulator